MIKILRWFKDWKKRKTTGAIPQRPDPRDYQYNISGSTNLPKEVDLREYFNIVRNQNRSESCSGFAVASVVEYQLNRFNNFWRQVSPLHLWYHGKTFHGWEDENKGVWLRNSLKALFNNGFVMEENFPFNSNYLRAPVLGKVFIVESVSKFYLEELAYFLLGPYSVKDSLAKGRPVIFGLWLNNSFYGNKDGIIKDIKKGPYAHAMVVVGYDDSRECFIVRNSWGARWGDNGYCYIPYNYFYEHSFDLWTIDYK